MTSSQLEAGGMIAQGLVGGAAIAQIVSRESASPWVVLLMALNCAALMYVCRLRRLQAERAQKALDQIIHSRRDWYPYDPVSKRHTLQRSDSKSDMPENRTH